MKARLCATLNYLRQRCTRRWHATAHRSDTSSPIVGVCVMGQTNVRSILASRMYLIKNLVVGGVKDTACNNC
jgi:hypothetical protein